MQHRRARSLILLRVGPSRGPNLFGARGRRSPISDGKIKVLPARLEATTRDHRDCIWQYWLRLVWQTASHNPRCGSACLHTGGYSTTEAPVRLPTVTAPTSRPAPFQSYHSRDVTTDTGSDGLVTHLISEHPLSSLLALRSNRRVSPILPPIPRVSLYPNPPKTRHGFQARQL